MKVDLLNKNLTIKKLENIHSSEVASLGKTEESFHCLITEDTWSEIELLGWFSDESDICLGCFLDTKLIAYCLTHHHVQTNKVHLENIYVLPEFRSEGVGSRLMSQVIQEYTSIVSDSSRPRFIALVKESNEIAQSFFKKNCFDIGVTMRWIQY